jgi:hypothetical protein
MSDPKNEATPTGDYRQRLPFPLPPSNLPLATRIEMFHELCGPEGTTDDSGEFWLDIKSQSYTPTRLDLVKRGIVVWSGKRIKLKNGRWAKVWVHAKHATQQASVPAPNSDGGVA